MANLASGYIEGNNEYVNVETALELNLEEDKTYQVQVQKGAMICESVSKPTEGGFYWDTLRPFGYKKESAYLWVKVNKGKSVYVNVAE